MKVARLAISNFRGIKSAELLFDGHTLMVGSNNVGKSTICEALDLVLGADRLNRFPAIDEFDFYNAQYLAPAAEGAESEPIKIRIEAILIDLSAEIDLKCGGNTEFWHLQEKRLLGTGEIAAANPPHVVPCLRVETIGQYNPEEDEFEVKTFFSHSPDAPAGELTQVPKSIKRQFGFLYLRTLRTGSRALSLERGSLLDIILRTKGVKTNLWEKMIDRLRNLEIEADAIEIAPVLRSVERRLSRYIALEHPGFATKLHVSELTREHLRKTMSFFLALTSDQGHVPFPHAGTGTVNTLVLALLSFIADLKPETVIFAMEEPEIAVPPHTQRRIANYFLTKTTQAFVTSHSPFVIERFEPSQTLLLSRQSGVVSSRKVSEATGLKDNEFKRYARWGLSECMLGKAAIVVEGLTEFHALPVAARRMEERDPNLQPLDIAGAAFFNSDGDGNGPKFGKFFKTLGLKTVAFYDYKANRPETQTTSYAENFDLNFEHTHKGFEDLVVTEMPAERLWSFLAAIKASGEAGNVGIPAEKPVEGEIRVIAKKALASNKGAGWAARLFEECDFEELPTTVTAFLAEVFSMFPHPPASEEDDQLPVTEVTIADPDAAAETSAAAA
ncbi:AAA family ATPase [Methylocaldum sp. RMAD-M]|jgi:putative ATP-dependent endonuclease of OLD family|uniref:ATP-dependent nuclease n=1 Tax=Methylocaldum sp. RMAD-M TaxID=2806557 RepID=UPI001AE60CF2|nr:AAA family ATPase [Methylocaldum sp. RMAD-M]MBP1152716.1 putative ATP-dependent endonuclease of OLD family [Methylocaldum sp. RMAD-M]